MVSKQRKIEIFSVVITSLVLGYLGVIGGLTLIAIDTPPQTKTTIKVVAKQFVWSFMYPDGTNSTGELRVKVGEAVLLEVVSLDVVHSFFIYSLGVKIDAIPGHVNHFWLQADTPGEYRIVCTQFCGVSHWSMSAKLIVEA